MAARTFAFSTITLSAGNYRVTGTDAFSNPEREINAIQMARTDGAIAVFERFKDRTINLDGIITTSSSANADAALDALKALVNAKYGNLDIGWGSSSTRRWNAILKNLIISRNEGDISRMGYSAQFYCPKPYATDTTSSTMINQAVTSTTNSIGVTIAGSYPASPLFTLTINSIAPSGAIEITLGNSAENRSIKVNANFVAGDVLVIDSDNNKVTLNGATVPFSGAFPIWVPGSGTIQVSDTATSRNITVLGTYPPRYL